MNMNVSLPDELAEYVKSKVSSGRYSSSSEVVREALRLLEQQDAANTEKLRWLQKAWADGVASGDAGEIDIEAIKAEAAKMLSGRQTA